MEIGSEYRHISNNFHLKLTSGPYCDIFLVDEVVMVDCYAVYDHIPLINEKNGSITIENLKKYYVPKTLASEILFSR